MKSNKMNQQPSSNALRMIAFAAFVGILGELGTIAFRKLVAVIHNTFFLGFFSSTYNENLHTPANILGMGIIVIPIIGGVCVIFLIEKLANKQRGLSVPEIMYDMYCMGGKIQFKVAVAKTVASAITIGTGGSVGREGPVFQIGAALSSIVSDFTHLSLQQRRVLIAAGVAACTAAIFHAPISGIIFAAEFLLAPISLFGLLLISIATFFSIAVEYFFINLNPIFSIQLVAQMSTELSVQRIFIFAIFGTIAGVISAIFIKGIYWFEDIFNDCITNVYLRHMIGMFLVGCLLFLMATCSGHYYIEGIGFATIQDCLHSKILNPWLLLLLVIAKLFATCLTLGSGASGGIFSPSLFIGATLGSAFGIIIHSLLPGLEVDPILFTLIGMAAMLGSTTGALLTSIILTTELTHSFQLIFPIFITVLMAYFVRRCFDHENIYSLKLHRRGVDLHHKFYN